ncbi:unnamed protein product [Calicophoron daubneyi]
MTVSSKSLKSWMYARHVKTGAEGYIPRNYVRFDDGLPENLDAFFDIDRLEAEKKLFFAGLPEGTYIIRRQDSGDGYVLSVRTYVEGSGMPRVTHYKLYCLQDQNQYYLFESRKFTSLEALLKYYSKNADDMPTKLASPCPRRYNPPVKFQSFLIPRSWVKLQEKLGEGEFGQVYRAVCYGQVEVAVKQCKVPANRHAFLQEAKVMHRLNHERIVSLLGFCAEPENAPLFIIMELLPNGPLSGYLRGKTGENLPLLDLILIILQISHGMSYLEKKRYVHRDLRASNVLVDRDGSVKVADFGLARLLESSTDYLSKSQFPLRWSPPESLAPPHVFSTQSDVWSFGVVMYEILTYGKRPYDDMTNDQVIEKVTEGYRLPNPLPHNPDGVKLYKHMLRCWKNDPGKRPKFKELHKIFCTWDVD